MNLFRTINKLFAGQPYFLQMNLKPEKVQLTIHRNEKVIDHSELLKVKSFPPVLMQFLQAQSSSGTNGYFLTLPQAQKLSTALRPHQSDHFQMDTNALDQLQLVPAPTNFKIHWQFDHSRQTLMRKLIGADGYLGEGWNYRGQQAWQLSPLNPNLLNWLDQSEVKSSSLYPFVKDFQLFRDPIFQCDLTIDATFQAKLQIVKTLKQSMDVQILSNKPELQKSLETIANDDQNLISRTTLLPGWGTKLRGQLLSIAKNDQPTRLSGNELLSFIQDDLTSNAADLSIDLAALRMAYPIDDAAKLPLKWIFKHTIVQGIGQYQAVPNLQVAEELISVQEITRQLETKNRFVAMGSRWLEFTARFKERYADWQQKGLRTIKLAPQEIMGAHVERLTKMGLHPPVIKLAKASTESEQIRLHIDMMCHHGLPAGVYGLQQEIGRVLVEACVRLLRENKQATILWMIPKRKQQEIATLLKKTGLPFGSDQVRQFEGRITLITPENAVLFNHEWTLIIFGDLDTLSSGEQQSKTLSALRRQWSISVFNHPDWFKDKVRVHRSLQALNLSGNDLSTFLELCYGNYSKQTESLLSRLTSPFKRIALNAESSVTESGDVRIPPRVSQSEPRPLKEVEKVYRPTFSVSVTPSTSKRSFLDEAKHFANHREGPAEPIPFMQYWPTYDAMTPMQKRWYFYWRSQVRSGNYLPTDLSYLFIHIYEIIHLVDFANAQSAADYLIILWQQYRGVHIKLDRYLVDWIADLHAVHHLSQTPMEWYATALEIGGRLSDQNLAIQAWLSQNGELNTVPENLLQLVSDYQPAKSKFVQQNNLDQSIDQEFRKSLTAIDNYLKQKDGKSLFERNRPTEMFAIQRRPFASAIYEGSREEVTIGTVALWTSACELRTSVTAILKYTENLLRRQRNFKGSLRGINIPSDWALLLDNLFPPPQTENKISKKAKSKGSSPESTTPVVAAAIVIDYSKVYSLTQESDHVRARLTVEDDQVDTSTGSESQAPTEVIQPVMDQLGNTSQLNVIRPDHTPEHLLTDLKAVYEVITGDPVAIKLFEYLKLHDWEVEEGAIDTILEGVFPSVVIDRINERAADHLGDQLIVTEGSLLIVTEDYRDELQHLLTQSVPPEIIDNQPSVTQRTQDLTSEWADFVQKMQPHHWEALNALITKEDVRDRLDGIARSVYITSDLLIDEINEFALTSIGDIVIEADDIPIIEDEDFETLQALMVWALENVLQEA